MQAFLIGINDALGAQLTASKQCEALAQLSTSGVPEPICLAANEMMQREAASRVRLSLTPPACCSF